jgi:hypothetical protein
MKRTLAAAFVLLIVANSCQLPPERVPVRPLPDDTPPLPYAELLTRARLQSTAATEAFYINNWADLEESAKGLSQTGRFMAKAIEVPEPRQKNLKKDGDELAKAAAKLASAAKAHDVKESNTALQQITLLVRELRPEESKEGEKDKAKDK